MGDIEERWKHPDICDLCGQISKNPWQEHIFPPDYTFVWCEKCAKNIKACEAVIHKAVAKLSQKTP